MNWHLVLDVLPQLIGAALLTLQLTTTSVFIGLLLAIPLSVLRTSGFRLVSHPILVYTFLFRGTPLLVQLFLVYYGASQSTWLRSSAAWAVLKEPYWCALIAFSLNHAAYATEILRGAIQAVPKGELEAAKALAMPFLLRMRRIVLPVAFRLALPAYANEVILMLKASSLASAITLMELTGTARKIVAETFAPYEVFLSAALVYLVLTFLCVRAFKTLEIRLSRHLVRSAPDRRKGVAFQIFIKRPSHKEARQ